MIMVSLGSLYFSNQSKEWKHKQIRIVSRALKIPIFTVIASKPNYKPQTIMFDTLFEIM